MFFAEFGIIPRCAVFDQVADVFQVFFYRFFQPDRFLLGLLNINSDGIGLRTCAGRAYDL